MIAVDLKGRCCFGCRSALSLCQKQAYSQTPVQTLNHFLQEYQSKRALAARLLPRADRVVGPKHGQPESYKSQPGLSKLRFLWFQLAVNYCPLVAKWQGLGWTQPAERQQIPSCSCTRSLKFDDDMVVSLLFLYQGRCSQQSKEEGG